MSSYITYILHIFISLITRSQRQDMFMMAQTEHTRQEYKPTSCKFDTDSVKLAIDTGASKCLTPSLQDFAVPPEPCNVPTQGIGNTQAHRLGTVK